MALIERIGIDLGRKLAVEDGIEWAAQNAVRFCDAQMDLAPNAMESFDEARCARVRELCDAHGVALGLHTLSAVNIAEISPFLREAADAYLRAYVDLAARVGAGWVVVHAGYHFTDDRDLRMQASAERLARAADYAEAAGVRLLLESMNREPDRAEVHYLGFNVEECAFFFDQIRSAALRWSFTVNHAHLVPEGIDGFIDALDLSRLDEVRIADCTGEYEVHLKPGEGNIDFGRMFARLEGAGYRGHYTNGFGTLDDMLEGRRYLVERAREAGVDVD